MFFPLHFNILLLVCVNQLFIDDLIKVSRFSTLFVTYSRQMVEIQQQFCLLRCPTARLAIQKYLKLFVLFDFERV